MIPGNSYLEVSQTGIQASKNQNRDAPSPHGSPFRVSLISRGFLGTVRQHGKRNELTRHCNLGPCTQDSLRHLGTQC